MFNFIRILFLATVLVGFISCEKEITSSPILIPNPQEISINKGSIDISNGFTIVANSELNALKEVIANDYEMLIKAPLTSGDFLMKLSIDSTLAKESYSINITKNIEITGGSYAVVAFAINTIWQAMDDNFQIPAMEIIDYPNYSYRSIMLDVARAWHNIETLKEIIDLCRWYKINYLHLHLTDDSAFTFPSDTYPELATKNHAYTKQQLTELNQYAFDRGVVLVPEIDVPGHSSQFIKKMPELFGIKDHSKNSYTVSMGREETYAALDTLINEIANVFIYSPYIHIGGDEAFFTGMEKDKATIAYMEKHELPNLHELFLHFLVRMNESVKKTGKQTIVWAGFGEKGIIQIPKDVIVLNWEHTYHDPNDLVEKGYSIINASFKPMYVVNNRKWDASYIYEQWNPNRWESWAHEGDFYGVELEENDLVMGATLCAWEQSQTNQMLRLRNRAAVMGQLLWSKPTLTTEQFESNQKVVDGKLSDLITPFKVSLQGISYPELKEGNFNEHRWFDRELSITTTTDFEDIELSYATTRNPKTNDWLPFTNELKLDKTSPIHIKASKNGSPLGRTYYQKFYHKPITISTKGNWKELPIGSWEKHRFEDTLTITLSKKSTEYFIRYTTDGKPVKTDSKIYEHPIKITSTTHLNAQLFDIEDEPVGSTSSAIYFKIWKEKSLTTGKPISASNDDIRPGVAKPANNGLISLWDMWGDHVQKENWVKVDLEEVTKVNRLKVYTFWDNWRYYQYTIEGSLDGENWFQLVDFSQNKEVATPQGIEHIIAETKVRYLRINMLYNSANPGLHLVEFSAFNN